VTGGTGRLGWHIVQRLVEKGFSVVATSRKLLSSNDVRLRWVKLFLEDSYMLSRVLDDVDPDVVIHTASETNVDACEEYREYAFRINVEATRQIAKWCGRYGRFMIYISTDYVFDGEKGMYTEGDVPRPVNFYGLTKLLGEEAVRSSCERYCIVRTSGLFGSSSPFARKSFVEEMLSQLLNGLKATAVCDQYLSPTYIPYLADAIVRIVERGEPTGEVIHIAGSRASRYDIAVRLCKLLGLDLEMVRPVSMAEMKWRARRPRDSSLFTGKAKLYKLEHPPLEECLRELVTRTKSNIISTR